MLVLTDGVESAQSALHGRCPMRFAYESGAAEAKAIADCSAKRAPSASNISSMDCDDSSGPSTSGSSAASDVSSKHSSAAYSGLQHSGPATGETGNKRWRPHPGCHQAWDLRPPVLRSCPRLSRRLLRALDRAWTLEEVAQHRYADDAWIAVNGKVYDITEHLASHPGWSTGCGISTVLSILAASGTECTAEFAQVHAAYPVAWKQLEAFYIGRLSAPGEEGP